MTRGGNRAAAAADEKHEAKVEKGRISKKERTKLIQRKIQAQRATKGVDLNQKRNDADDALTTDAASVLWGMYRAWCGRKRLSKAQATAEEWTSEQVISVGDGAGKSLEQIVHEIVGEDFAKHKNNPDDPACDLPSAAALVVTAKPFTAKSLRKSLGERSRYRELLWKKPNADTVRNQLKRQDDGKGPLRSAVTTAVCLMKMCQDEMIGLQNTRVLVLDCRRHTNKQNLLDQKSWRNALFTVIYENARPFINEGKLKIVVFLPPKKQMEKVEQSEHEVDKEVDDLSSLHFSDDDALRNASSNQMAVAKAKNCNEEGSDE